MHFIKVSDEDIEEMFSFADKDNDGKIRNSVTLAFIATFAISLRDIVIFDSK